MQMDYQNEKSYAERLEKRITALEMMVLGFGNPDKLLNRIDALEESLYMTKTVLNFKEAAQYLGIAKSMLYKHTHEGNIPCYRPSGKMLYFDKQELDDWLRQNLHEAYERKTEIKENAAKMIEEYVKQGTNGLGKAKK